MRAIASLALHPAVLTGCMVANYFRSSEFEGLSPERRLQQQSSTALPAIANLIIIVIVSLVVAAVYKSTIADKRRPFPDPVPETHRLAGKDFKYDTFACCDNFSYCLYGWCCLDARIADTLSTAQIGTYWSVVLVWVGVVAFGQGISAVLQVLAMVLNLNSDLFVQVGSLANLAAGVLLAAWLADKRRALRRKLGDTADDKFMMDCVCFWCCSCCTAIQDARQVDEASNTKVECCLKLVHTAEPVVGPPVMIGIDGVPSAPVLMGTEGASAPEKECV